MNYKILISEEAETEIKKAKEWYENQSFGLGDKFSEEVKKILSR